MPDQYDDQQEQMLIANSNTGKNNVGRRVRGRY